MNPSVTPEQLKTQIQEQLRVITFVQAQKGKLMGANTGLIRAITDKIEEMVTLFPSDVIHAYVTILELQNEQYQWEVTNLQRDVDRLGATLDQIDEQTESRILRPIAMPVPPGPRNIR